MLGGPYSMTGEVVSVSKQLGRTIGIPTLRISLPGAQAVPPGWCVSSGSRIIQGEAYGDMRIPFQSLYGNPPT